nr:hypothetical protein VITISV_017528 [Ipomoea batatas]
MYVKRLAEATGLRDSQLRSNCVTMYLSHVHVLGSEEEDEYSNEGLQHHYQVPRRRLQSPDDGRRRALQRAQQLGVNLGAGRQILQGFKLIRAVEFPLKNRPGKIVTFQLLLLLECSVGFQCSRDFLTVNKEPGIHAGHTRLQGLPWSPLDGLEDQSVLRDEELGGFRELCAEILELLYCEAFVPDSGQEVAVLELLLHGFDGLFFPGSADG